MKYRLLNKKEARLLIARYFRNLLGFTDKQIPDEMQRVSKK